MHPEEISAEHVNMIACHQHFRSVQAHRMLLFGLLAHIQAHILAAGTVLQHTHHNVVCVCCLHWRCAPCCSVPTATCQRTPLLFVNISQDMIVW